MGFNQSKHCLMGKNKSRWLWCPRYCLWKRHVRNLCCCVWSTE